jgi:hypothetical protein
LRSGLAGEILQKFINYGLRVAVVGDFAAFAAQSSAVRDFLRESKRGNAILFRADLAEVRMRLGFLDQRRHYGKATGC